MACVPQSLGIATKRKDLANSRLAEFHSEKVTLNRY